MFTAEAAGRIRAGQGRRESGGLRREERGNVMPDLKLYRARAERGQAAGRTGGRATGSAPGRRDRALARARGAAALVAPKALWRSHRLFTILTLLSLLPRILATRAFRPATLTAAPPLFDTRQIALESYILPDTLYCLVIVAAVALLLTRRTPRPWQC